MEEYFAKLQLTPYGLKKKKKLRFSKCRIFNVHVVVAQNTHPYRHRVLTKANSASDRNMNAVHTINHTSLDLM